MFALLTGFGFRLVRLKHWLFMTASTCEITAAAGKESLFPRVRLWNMWANRFSCLKPEVSDLRGYTHADSPSDPKA